MGDILAAYPSALDIVLHIHGPGISVPTEWNLFSDSYQSACYLFLWAGIGISILIVFQVFRKTKADFSNLNFCLRYWKTQLSLAIKCWIWSTNLLTRTVILLQSGQTACDQPATSPLWVLGLFGDPCRVCAISPPWDSGPGPGLKLNLTFSLCTVVDPEDHFTTPSLGPTSHQA